MRRWNRTSVRGNEPEEGRQKTKEYKYVLLKMRHAKTELFWRQRQRRGDRVTDGARAGETTGGAQMVPIFFSANARRQSAIVCSRCS